jgi:hypothetical protein
MKVPIAYIIYLQQKKRKNEILVAVGDAAHEGEETQIYVEREDHPKRISTSAAACAATAAGY